MDNFLDRFDIKKRGFARGVSKFNIPESQYLLDNVELQIRVMEDFWGIAFNEAEEGTSVSPEDCWYLNRRFDIPVGRKKDKFWYQVAMSQCGLEKLSQANNNTTFSDCDENYRIIRELKDDWTNLLFQIPGFEDALFKLVSSRRAYDELPLSEKSHEHIYFLQEWEAKICINKIAKEVDQKLFEFTENPRVFESDSLYLPLLSKLGIQVTVIEEPVESTVTLPQDKILVHEQIAKLQSQIAILQQQLAELQLLI
jgi:hypothetical protein